MENNNVVAPKVNLSKAIYKAKLKLKTPLFIGSGDGENSDSDVIRDGQGKPYIPATSFIGVVSSLLKKNNEEIFGTEAMFEERNGKEEYTGKQSQIIVHNLTTPNKTLVTIRDGIAIQPETQVVIDKHKYDYEVVEPGIEFNLTIELLYFSERVKSFIKTINTLLSNQELSFGAKTNNGFGKLQLIESNLYQYDLSNQEHVWYWLKRETNSSLKTNLDEVSILNLPNKTFTIQLKANLDSSFIIRNYRHNHELADSVHLTSNGKPIISGSSLKGAIRNRALKIVNTLEKNKSVIENLFGYDPEESKRKSKKEEPLTKGRIQVNEVSLSESGINQELQQRIKIDRFTGGTIDGALFNSMPIFSKNGNESNLNFEIKIYNPEKEEIGLLLLVLKDLWTGDLPIGGEKNVGRGRLKGVEAIITWDDIEVKIKEENQTLKATFTKDNRDAWEELEKFVTALNGLVGQS